jgi:membrane protein implicated in regulation of membrane protease activity
MSKNSQDENRGRQILVAALVLLIFTTLLTALMLGWRKIPGWVGEGFGILAGIFSTPFVMETSFALIGLLTVIAVNTWRRRKDGEEFVEWDDNKPE